MRPSLQKALNTLHLYEQLYGEEILQIIGAANRYIVMNLGDGMAAGAPNPVDINGRRVWSMAIVLAPKCNGPAEVGSILIDDDTRNIVGVTDRETILRNVGAMTGEETTLV